ncbi:MAG TPA: hypothetical protein VEQ58_12480 [Polyangiaceae bacterium]|nr:hypothetical protein [Polyangiaceae bacterium]
MGDRTHSSSSGLRLLVRLLSAVAMLTVLCVSGRAAASPLTGAVPMCGEHNESVAAPPIFVAQGDAAINALPCHSSELAVDHGAPAAPERVIVYERPERVLGFGALLVAQSECSRLPVVSASRAPLRPGFVSSPFRPPQG